MRWRDGKRKRARERESGKRGQRGEQSIQRGMMYTETDSVGRCGGMRCAAGSVHAGRLSWGS